MRVARFIRVHFRALEGARAIGADERLKSKGSRASALSPNIPQANDFNAFVSALMRRSRSPAGLRDIGALSRSPAGLRDIGALSRSPAGNVTYDFFIPNRSESPTQFDARISAPTGATGTLTG